ncbi:hypothetical protein MIND_00403200 [Mycena indigotica]|uniref:Uncharacterized protein n=1 Tax=Mycena indigotica TaxID=2126181 RepID=A0A8H6WA21_9AGAR|nr:uncharacterized protein MIND_00403200 [Mycena indigotica]KAF7310292.1 hypothetical protein MIND_00403200 [Mycena indigotica]
MILLPEDDGDAHGEKGEGGGTGTAAQFAPGSPYPSATVRSWATYPGAASSLSPASEYSTLSPAWRSAPPAASDGHLPLSPHSPAHSHSHSHSHSALNLHPVTVVGPAQPASLTRPRAAVAPAAFAPMFLLAEGNSLKRGFPVIPPPSGQSPHPFSVHDVGEGDWREFLDELRTAARLTERDRQNAYRVPILSMLPVINAAIASALRHHMQGKKAALVALLVDKWNHHFFHARSLEVILMRGQSRLSGQSDKPVPGLHTPRTVRFAAPPLAAAGTGKEGDGDGEKTYRLFVVSMVA